MSLCTCGHVFYMMVRRVVNFSTFLRVPKRLLYGQNSKGFIDHQHVQAVRLPREK